jgi:YjbE family integral membrane protein
VEIALDNPLFWFAVLQIIAIDILLGGDNAVVIALACRSLPEHQRKKGILWGVGGAIILRVALTAFAVTLLAIPYLKIIGGLLLLWIGCKLIIPEDGDEEEKIDASTTLIGAIKTIIIADFVMSLDNVIAVAAAAKDSVLLIVFGLLVSIPIIVWCSQIILKLMDRFPVIITLGGALLGYIAGDMMARDPAVTEWVKDNAAWLQTYHIAGVIGAIGVVVAGKIFVLRRSSRAAVQST